MVTGSTVGNEGSLGHYVESCPIRDLLHHDWVDSSTAWLKGGWEHVLLQQPWGQGPIGGRQAVHKSLLICLGPRSMKTDGNAVLSVPAPEALVWNNPRMNHEESNAFVSSVCRFCVCVGLTNYVVR